MSDKTYHHASIMRSVMERLQREMEEEMKRHETFLRMLQQSRFATQITPPKLRLIQGGKK